VYTFIIYIIYLGLIKIRKIDVFYNVKHFYSFLSCSDKIKLKQRHDTSLLIRPPKLTVGVRMQQLIMAERERERDSLL